MMGRFTERAQVAINLSQESAKALGHGYVGTEHILLGLIKEGEGVAAKVLKSNGVTEETWMEKIKEIIVNSNVQTKEFYSKV